MNTSPIGISPTGRLFLEREGLPFEGEGLREIALANALAEGTGPGLLHLAGEAWRRESGPTFVFWRDFANRFLVALCHTPGIEQAADTPIHPPDPELLRHLANDAPPMTGMEYLDAGRLGACWDELAVTARAAIRAHPEGTRGFLRDNNPAWHLVGRVTFHLAENKKDATYPFAFLATYTGRLSAESKPQYQPLARALQEYAGAKNKAALLNLLQPVYLAAEKSAVIQDLLDAGAIYHPQRWTPQQAYAFLRDIPVFEDCGVITRAPNWWKNGGAARPRLKVSVTDRPKKNTVGQEALLDFSASMALDGEPLTQAEWASLMNAAEGLVFLRGQWVEVDARKLEHLMERWGEVEEALADGLSFAEGMRLLAGAPIRPNDATALALDHDWMDIQAEGRLRELLEGRPGSERGLKTDGLVQATLRPYQQDGIRWLHFMTSLELGACLADDMGLGKTIQVLALLSARRQAGLGGPNLLVVPASLMANWRTEIDRFAPFLNAALLHPSENGYEALLKRLSKGAPSSLDDLDLVITTYAMAARLTALTAVPWRLVMLDEAQAIKNPGTRQTRAVKAMPAQVRIALTGTPVENRPTDLWSLFDFLNPGLLGGQKDFAAYLKKLPEGPGTFAPLRALTRPYILRRLKTDRTIIADLPDKTEVRAFCSLAREQAALYQQVVDSLRRQIDESDGIQRRGLILAAIMRFKQICNHPAHGAGDNHYAPERSGKFQRLGEVCTEIAARQEKALVFTQFQEIMEPLERYLSGIFGRGGALLHGGTPVKRRRELVNEFQREAGPPFFVLSLKAGGTGLNLTAASHVIHFDRWWNPAVENQATDRAFRIGQKRNVLVHKFVCRGTIEEKIDALIEEKVGIARDLLDEESGVNRLTEMSNEDVMQLVALDIRAATGE